MFRLLTGRTVPDGRKPDESVEGMASIQDPRVDALSEVCKPQKTTYAENHFVLCPDVEEGTGRRDWLDAARRCDLVCLVVRAFESDSVYHPAGSVNVERDMANLRAELLLADMALVETRLQRLAKEQKAGLTTAQALEQATLEKCMAAMEDDRTAADAGLEEHELSAIRSLDLVTMLPVLEVLNVSEDALADETSDALPISCLIEEEITTIEDPAERREYLESLGLDTPGVDRMNQAAYTALGLMSFYTIGPDEVRAWTIREGALAPVAGGKIHSDIERGFIRVEVIKVADLLAAGSEKAARDAGHMQLRGKDYVMEDGDICHFLFNV